MALIDQLTLRAMEGLVVLMWHPKDVFVLRRAEQHFKRRKRVI
jgi:hypothetical protein